MGETIKLSAAPLSVLRTVNDKLMSYNVEFTEVTGGTFWKAYTPEQIAGTEKFHVDGATDIMSAMASLMQMYPPINLYDEKLRKLAKEFGPVWVRVSGTWATKTYYDFDGTTNGVAPEGYQNILTKEQWTGVLDFVKAIGAKLLISVANCEGLHKADEPWNPSQAEIIFKYSRDYGVPIDAAEFTNEPNILDVTGFPPGYTAEDYARDQDLFFKWLRANYPDTLCVGPCSTEGSMGDSQKQEPGSGGIADLSGNCASTDDLMRGTVEPIDVYSYHYYNGVSERLELVMPAMHWDSDKVLSERYLAVAPNCAKENAPRRDKYCPDGEMWVTESGDAGGGGDTWASTYTDVFRTLNELGSFATITDGVIFHNTLASSDYGFLKHGTFDPRPNYFAALLWNRIMGTTVYDTKEEIREGAHVYAHSRKDGKDGIAYLIINNSENEATTVTLPKTAECYTLSAPSLRSSTMYLNGKALVLGADNELPDMSPEIKEAGDVALEPASIMFVVL